MAASTAALRRRARLERGISGTGAGSELAATALTGAGQAGRAGAGRVGAGTEASSDQASSRNRRQYETGPPKAGHQTHETAAALLRLPPPHASRHGLMLPRACYPARVARPCCPGCAGDPGQEGDTVAGWHGRSLSAGLALSGGPPRGGCWPRAGPSSSPGVIQPGCRATSLRRAAGSSLWTPATADGRGPRSGTAPTCWWTASVSAEDAARLLPLARDTASTVLISSKAVYVDGAGRHSNSPVNPDFGGPVREDQPTVAPGYGDYRSAAGYPAGKSPPSGCCWTAGPRSPCCARPRFTARDRGSPASGSSSSACSTAARCCSSPTAGPAGPSHGRRQHRRAHRAGRGPAGTADPERRRPGRAERPGDLPGHRPPPRAHLGRSPPRRPAGCARSASTRPASTRPAARGQPALGRHPWDRAYPFVLDMTAAARLGYVPAGDYAATVAAAVDWLAAAAGVGRTRTLSLVPQTSTSLRCSTTGTRTAGSRPARRAPDERDADAGAGPVDRRPAGPV